MKYDDLTSEIIGCAIKVHNEIGNGFQELIYQRCLAIEFDEIDINYIREAEMPLSYKKREVGTRRVDFFVDGRVLVELKAITELNDTHLAQALNYLEAFSMEVGLLINFGSTSLQIKRLFNKKINLSR